MTTSAEIKELARHCGADLCGIAPVERFENAPEGFHPFNIYPGAKSVIAIAVREPESALYSASPVPYTFVSEKVLGKVFDITIEMVSGLEKSKIVAIPIPSEPYEYWDKETMTGKGILSLKHAGYLAGLGVIGRNTLLVNKQYGNLIRLGAIITNAELEGDPLQDFVFCNDACNLCIDGCPGGAIENAAVSQWKCRPNSTYTNERGYALYTCNNCRKVCPYKAGMDDSFTKPLELSKIILVKNLMI
jgi:epoxyqueuosine reductase QueG